MEKVSETTAYGLVAPKLGAVAAHAALLCASDSREASAKLASKPGHFRPGLATGCLRHPDWGVVAILDCMVLNLIRWLNQTVIMQSIYISLRSDTCCIDLTLVLLWFMRNGM